MSEQAKQPQPEQKTQFLGAMDECGQRAQYHNLVDILFVIDATGSMSWCISQLKKTVCKIMKKFSDKQYNIKFAIELYRDHPPQEYSYIEKHFDLRSQDDIIKVIDDECEVGGGGDTPEAVFDGLVHGLKKTKWRVSSDGKTRSKRFLFHGADAPPHGKQYGCTSSDPKWTENGAPSGFTRQDVKKLLDEYNVDYSLIKCGNQVDVMATLFKECFAERFKRQLEIKQEKNSYKRGKRGGGGLERKLSVQYMEQVEREEREGSGKYDSGSEEEYEQEVEHYHERGLCVDELDMPVAEAASSSKKKQSFFDSIKRVFRSSPDKAAQKVENRKMAMRQEAVIKEVKKEVKKKKKQKAVKKEVVAKKKQASDDSSGQDGAGRPRSMASLVLSDIEDGIESHFEEKKQEKKVTRDI